MGRSSNSSRDNHRHGGGDRRYYGGGGHGGRGYPRYETHNYERHQRHYPQPDQNYSGPNHQHQNRRDRYYDRPTHRDEPAHHGRHDGQRQDGREQHSCHNEHEPESAYGQASNHQAEALDYVRHSDPLPQPNANGSHEKSEVAPAKAADDDRKPTAVDERNNDTPFHEMSHEDKLIAQIPESENTQSFLEKLPPEAFFIRSLEWEQRKREIVEELVRAEEKNRDKCEKDKDSDEMVSDCDSDEVWEEKAFGPHPGAVSEFDLRIDFIRALPSCLLLTVGFDVSGIDAHDERCFCPCGKKMKRWRKLAGVSVESDRCDTGRNSGSGVFNCPNDLMDHLRKKKDEGYELHRLTVDYLEKLYDSYDREGIKHKGLLIKGHRDYWAAVREEKMKEKRRNESVVRELKEMLSNAEALQKQRHIQEEERAKLEKLNCDLAKSIKNRDTILKRLGVSVDGNEPPPTKDTMLKLYEEQWNDYLSQIHDRFDVSTKKCSERTIEVDHDFKLQELFDQWFSSKTEFASVLFKDFSPSVKKRNKEVRNVLSMWQINYTAALQDVSPQVKRDLLATDEGGPEAQFFSQVWAQVPSLTVSTPDGKILKLFESLECGFCPMKDEFFDQNDSDLMGRIRVYYRALGRLVVNCLSMKRKMPNQMLPKLFRNVIIRECEPESVIYTLKDITTHLMELGINKKTIEWMKTSPPEGYRDYVANSVTRTRQIWCESFREGIELPSASGKPCVKPSVVCRSMPLAYVNRLFFASHKFKACKLKGILTSEYSEDQTLKETQVLLVENVLPEILDDWEKKEVKSREGDSMLNAFLFHCTGQTYLPDPKVEPDFKIKVVFEVSTGEGQSSSASRLPEVHTCVKWLSLPLEAYNGDREIFEEKLSKSIESSSRIFSMR